MLEREEPADLATVRNRLDEAIDAVTKVIQTGHPLHLGPELRRLRELRTEVGSLVRSGVGRIPNVASPSDAPPTNPGAKPDPYAVS